MMKKLFTGALIVFIAVVLLSGCNLSKINTKALMSDYLGVDTAKKDFNEAWSLYTYCQKVEGKAYDVYNYTVGEAYVLEASKAYDKGQGPNFERARMFSLMAIPYLKAVQKKYLEAEGS